MRSRRQGRAATAARPQRPCGADCAPHRRVGWRRWPAAHRRRFCASWAGTSLAGGWDGRALALAGGDPEAAGDALTGLAADALGVGRLAAAATLLRRADPLVAQAPHRLAVRRAWVAAELAMAGGEGAVAVRNAEARGRTGRGPRGAARHRAKSEVVLAAALCSAGDVDRARAVGEAALQLTGRLGLVPLRWAVACLLVDLVGRRRPEPTRVARHPRRVRPPGAALGRSLAPALTGCWGHYCRSGVPPGRALPGP